MQSILERLQREVQCESGSFSNLNHQMKIACRYQSKAVQDSEFTQCGIKGAQNKNRRRKDSCSYPDLTSGGTGRGLVNPSFPTSQKVCSTPFPWDRDIDRGSDSLHFIHMQKSQLSDKGSYLDFRLASQLELVAEVKVLQDLHCALVDVDPVGCSKPKHGYYKFHVVGKKNKNKTELEQERSTAVEKKNKE